MKKQSPASYQPKIKPPYFILQTNGEWHLCRVLEDKSLGYTHLKTLTAESIDGRDREAAIFLKI